MNLGSTSLQLRCLAVMLVVISSGGVAEAGDAGKVPEQAIIVSTPKNSAAGAEVNLLGTGKYDLNALGNGSLDSPNSFSSQNSLSGLMAPLPSSSTTVIRGGQTEDMLDRRKDWVFLSPEELILGLTPREAAILQGSQNENDSQNNNDQMFSDQSLSPAARFYQTLVRQKDRDQQNAGPNQNQQTQKDLFGGRYKFIDMSSYGMQDSGLRDSFSQGIGAGGVSGIAINASGFQQALDSAAPTKNIFSASDARGKSSSPYGLGRYGQPSDGDARLPDPNDYVAQFKALINPQTPATTPVPAPDPFGGSTSAGADSGLPAGFGTVASPAQVKAYNPQWSNPALLRSTVPTVGATLNGQSDWGLPQPSSESTRMQPQTFTMPKRWF